LGAILRAARAPARTLRDGRPPGSPAFLDRVAADGACGSAGVGPPFNELILSTESR
jgi:hypothetical protein